MARKHFLPLIDSGLDYSGEGDNATLTGTTASTDFPPSMLEESFQHLPMTALGETRYWVATSAGNTNDTANWGLAPGSSGGASIPTIENTVYFTADAGGDCTFNASLTCKGWIIDGYTGTIAQGAYNLTVGTSTTSNGISQNSGTWTKTTGEIDHYGRWSPTGGTFNGGSGRINFTAFQAGVRCDFVATGGTYTDTSGNHYTRGGAGDQGEWNVGSGCTYDANGGTQWPYAMMNITMASGKLFGTLRAAGGCIMKSDLYGTAYDAGSGALESDVATPYKVSVTGNLYIPYSDSATNRPNYEATGSGAQAIKAGFGNYLIINKTAGAVTITNQDGGWTGAVVKFVVTAIGTGSINGTTWILNGIGDYVRIDTSAVPALDVSLGTMASRGYTLVGKATFALNFTHNSITETNLDFGTKTTVVGICSIGSASVSGTELRCEGNFVTSNNTRSGTVATLTFGGSAAQTFNLDGDGFVDTYVVNKSGGTLKPSANSNTNLAGSDFVDTAGVLDLNGYNITVTDQLQVANGADFRLKGSETVTVTGTSFGATSNTEYYNTAGSNTIKPFTYGHLDIDGIGGTFIDAAGTIGVQGNYSKTNGTLTLTGATVFSGAGDSVISGGIVFNSLAFGVSKTHKFTAAETFRVNGVLSSNGTASTRSILRSTVDATQWLLNLQGTSTLGAKVDVQDSDASSGNSVAAVGSIGLTQNNVNWIFTSPGDGDTTNDLIHTAISSSTSSVMDQAIA